MRGVQSQTLPPRPPWRGPRHSPQSPPLEAAAGPPLAPSQHPQRPTPGPPSLPHTGPLALDWGTLPPASSAPRTPDHSSPASRSLLPQFTSRLCAGAAALGAPTSGRALPSRPLPSRPQRRHVAEGRHVGERGAHEWVLRPGPLSCRSFPICEVGPDSAAPATPRAPGTWKLLSLLPGVAFPPLGRADSPVSRWRDQGPEKGGAGLGPKHPREPLSHAKPGTSSAHS